MTTEDDEAFDALVRIWSVWWSGVPDHLARQESSLVVRLLTLGLREGGISQSELKRQLGIAQPRLSKLMVKLLKVKWIEVKRSKKDRRVWLMTTTVKAQSRMASLKQDLAILFQAQGARQTPVAMREPNPSSSIRKRIERQARGSGFDFEELESDGNGTHEK